MIAFVTIVINLSEQEIDLTEHSKFQFSGKSDTCWNCILGQTNGSHSKKYKLKSITSLYQL